ncbi:MAG: ABC transporter substrate-binding protein [Clostridia bacterium]|nr:ABC transporter substrate-binding protein [Clostridia bacterium]
MKKVIAVVLTLTLSLLFVCSALADNYVIGIQQFAEHGSLDNCRNGFLEGLKEAGFAEGENLTVLYQNAQAHTGDAAQIADSFVAQNVDLILAIATPSAQISYNSVLNAGKEIPVIYSAVSAPIEAGLALEDGLPVGAVTGTSDVLPVTGQLTLIRALQPEAKKIGLLYTASETNSAVQAAEYKANAEAYGFEIVEQIVTQGSEVSQAVEALLPQVDCLSMLLDNTVVSYLTVVLDAANKQSKPVYGSEIEQVVLGCVASEGLDYISLGKQTGAIAARVLNGEKAEDIPFETIKESALYLNSDAIEMLGLTIPEALITRGYTDMSAAE